MLVINLLLSPVPPTVSLIPAPLVRVTSRASLAAEGECCFRQVGALTVSLSSFWFGLMEHLENSKVSLALPSKGSSEVMRGEYELLKPRPGPFQRGGALSGKRGRLCMSQSSAAQAPGCSPHRCDLPETA